VASDMRQAQFIATSCS